MARAANGTYTRVSNSFSAPIVGATISPSDAELFFDDIETEITDSLSRSGKGGMLAALTPNTTDGYALGSATLMWSDLFLALGAVVNFNNGDVTVTHAANSLAFAGASSGYSFDAALTVAGSGALTASDIDVRLHGGGLRRVTAAGSVTADATTDHRIHVAKTIEAATPILFPTVAARIATGGFPYFIKNEMSNGALYPLTPTPSGSEKIEGVASAYTMDSQRQGLWFWPDNSVTPNNWEIR